MGKIANRQSLAILDRGLKSQRFSQFCCIGVFKTNRQSRVSNRNFKSQGRQRFESRVFIRQRPPGLIQLVLTVLVFWAWVLLLTRLPLSSWSLKLLPCASILLRGPLDIRLDLLPAAPLPPVQKRDAQHKFLHHRGAHADFKSLAILDLDRAISPI